MPNREQDETPYFTPGILDTAAPATPTDEVEFSTLKTVAKELNNSMAALYGDFNAFDILKEADSDKAASNLLRQVEAKQIAYDILFPAVDAINGAIQKIDAKYKQ